MRPLRILVVDDDQDCANTLAALVRLWGHHTVAAYSEHQALASAAVFRPDVALLDLCMPFTNGYCLAYLLRQVPGCGKLILVAVTGQGSRSDYEASCAHGFAAHLIKGHEVDDLPGLLFDLAPPESALVAVSGSAR